VGVSVRLMSHRRRDCHRNRDCGHAG
jgi:hypothetical protein